MKKIILVDDLFQEKELQSLKNRLGNFQTGERWYDYNSGHMFSDVCLDLIKSASYYYDTSDCVGYEFWTHNNSRPSTWHYDKDEKHFKKYNEYKFPICSIVFYLRVENLNGGRLWLKNTKIKPKENRLIIFPPGYYHYVEEFTGIRHSILVNPWDYKLE